MALSNLYDCIVIGAGPSGLMAGIYLQRFLRNILIIHDNKSRAKIIPKSYNIPGHTAGISGEDFIACLLRQYHQYSDSIILAHVDKIAKNMQTDSFLLMAGNKIYHTKNVILATGIEDKVLKIPGLEAAKEKDFIRECPICDAYEYKNKTIAVLGDDEHAAKEAIFLAHYTQDLYLILTNNYTLEPDTSKQIAEIGIKLIKSPVQSLQVLDANKISINFANKKLAVEAIYMAYGCHIRSSLATNLGVQEIPDSGLIVDAHQATSVPGLYAIGDVVEGVKQITTGLGQAVIAAIKIHQSL